MACGVFVDCMNRFFFSSFFLTHLLIAFVFFGAGRIFLADYFLLRILPFSLGLSYMGDGELGARPLG